MKSRLQIIQLKKEMDLIEIEIRYLSDFKVLTTIVEGIFLLSETDEESIRWYLEEFLLYPFDAASKIAQEIEERINDIGISLFNLIFKSTSQAQEIWKLVDTYLSETRFEILTDRNQSFIPWEFLKSGLNPSPIACCSNSFVRIIKPNVAIKTPLLINQTSIRILFVIPRPQGQYDIPLRAVCKGVLQRIFKNNIFEFEILRPPTFSELEIKLREAHENGNPYSIVHFDGHGIYEDLLAKYSNKPQNRKRGYLIFENELDSSKSLPVDGTSIGSLLYQYGVSVVLLNACRSGRDENKLTEKDNSSIVSYGSLAEEMVKAGVQKVVAMRYNIWVDTAADFIAEIYEYISNNLKFENAITKGRNYLFNNPNRTVKNAFQNLQDWMVPVLFEAEDVTTELFISHSFNKSKTSVIFSELPTQKHLFIGRDDILLLLDRNFQNYNVIVLWGLIGCGKTSTAIEFAHWESNTQGIKDSVIYTTFKNHNAVPNLCDQVAILFKDLIKISDIDWNLLTSVQKEKIIIEILGSKSVLWIWDDVDFISNQGSKYRIYSENEIYNLFNFLSNLCKTSVKILLLSRSETVSWIPNNLFKIHLQPLEIQDRITYVESILSKSIYFDLKIWKPLLDFSDGNPLTLSLITKEKLSKNINSKKLIKPFLEQFYETKDLESLSLSLLKDIKMEFNKHEQGLISLCYLFDHNILPLFLDALEKNKNSENFQSYGFDKFEADELLTRLSKYGILSKDSRNNYNIHPGLKLIFKKLIVEFFTPDEVRLIQKHFVILNLFFVDIFYKKYLESDNIHSKLIIEIIKYYESNLKKSLELGCYFHTWDEVVELLTIFKLLYEYLDKWTELKELIQFVSESYENNKNSLISKSVKLELLILEIKISLLKNDHKLFQAKELQSLFVTKQRNFLNESESSSEDDKLKLAEHLKSLADIQRELEDEECFKNYSEALEIAQNLNKIKMESIIACQLGIAHQMKEFLNFEKSKFWLTYALDTTSLSDSLGRGNIFLGFGSLSYIQFYNSKVDDCSALKYLNDSIEYYTKALQFLPLDYKKERADCLQNLALAQSYENKNLSLAFGNFQQALSLNKDIGDIYSIGLICYNIAIVLDSLGDFNKSRFYVQASLEKFANLMPNAEKNLQQSQDLLEQLNSKLEN